MSERVDFLFGKGWVHSRDLIYAYGATREDNASGKDESVVVRWKNGEWGLWQVATRLCGIATATAQAERIIYCVGIDGYVETYDSQGVRSEGIDAAADGPDDLRHITFMRPLGNHVFAVGMFRMVYRRDLRVPGWQRMDEGMRVPRESLEITGLKCIDGDGRGRYVACGFHGELWLYEQNRWRRLVSPTNVKLESVRWVGKTLYVAGGGGLLLRGPPDELEIVEQTTTKETFWSIECYRDELYLATGNSSVWVLRGDDLEPVKFPDSAPSTGWLHANDGVLLSVGSSDLMLFDGDRWQSLKPPPPEVDWPLEW